MPTAHNEAIKEDIAKTVIMPGDPKRAKYIAEKYLTDYKLVNEVRGMYAYTGFYKGKRITVMAHGMGIPSAAIYSYELYDFYDVDTIIRVGSAGSYTTALPIKSILLVDKSYSDTNFDTAQSDTNYDEINASFEVNKVIEEKSKELNLNITKGTVYCSEAFYTEDSIYDKMYKEHNCLAVEMESFAIFYNAKKLNKKAACILTVSDSLVTKEELSSVDRERSFDDMIVLALESTLKL